MVIVSPIFPHASGQPAFVLDVSVALGWIVPSLASSYSDDVLPALLRAPAVVPQWWISFVTAAVRKAERQNLLTPQHSARQLATLRKQPILFDDETDARAWHDILALSRRLRTSVENAAYIELAVRLNRPLATADAPLTRSAAAAGVPIFTP
jgi:predicted nucleic acid-binding protein